MQEAACRNPANTNPEESLLATLAKPVGFVEEEEGALGQGVHLWQEPALLLVGAL